MQWRPECVSGLKPPSPSCPVENGLKGAPVTQGRPGWRGGWLGWAGGWWGSSGHREKLIALENSLIYMQRLSQFHFIKKECSSTQDSLVN